jgi:hypothetical protein
MFFCLLLDEFYFRIILYSSNLFSFEDNTLVAIPALLFKNSLKVSLYIHLRQRFKN